MSTNEQASSVRRGVTAAALGNIIEWFDYGVYSFAAVTIGTHFFATTDPATAATSSFAVFALSFLVRPIGGVVIGVLGDRRGRRDMLMLTVGLMTAATVAIGLLPTYAQIGFLAPALLTLARLVQGFSAGGEYGGANTFMAEVSPAGRRGFFASILETGVLIGYLGGAGVVVGLMSALPEEAWQDWGWRIPFIASLPLGILALLLRRHLEDTPVFEKMKAAAELTRSPLFDTFRRAPLPLLVTFLIVAYANGAYYLILTFLPSYAQTELGLSANLSLTLSIVVMLALLLTIPLFGRLGDRIGRTKLITASVIAHFVLAIPAVLLLTSGNVVAVFAATLILGVAIAPLASQYAAALTVLFPRSIRYTGFTLSFNVATAIFGGSAPFIVGSLLSATGNQLVIAFFLMGTAILAGIGIRLLPETMHMSADHDESMGGSGITRSAEAKALAADGGR
ncbi:MFS transporter [Pseudarthrobacter sp. B4EP4b]|uniref:MFS transporter n=1 Tax=Pseudarthrobacter sp. B4EP4b TaxID=2590664 RepID=UPI001151FD0C|nr:MFS transporter [Pseudarthrobacter sp. B4EP4b]